MSTTPWRLSVRLLLACVATIAIADVLMSLWHPPLAVQGLLDELAHAATGLLALGALSTAVAPRVVWAVLAGSVLIDLDHLPGYLGSDVLVHGTARPVTHSLATVLLIAAAAQMRRGEAQRLIGIGALALLLHFLRDMAEPNGPGVTLLWPLSDRSFSLSYGWYAALLAALAVAALARRSAATRGRLGRGIPRQDTLPD